MTDNSRLVKLLQDLISFRGISPGCGGAVEFLRSLFLDHGFFVQVLCFNGFNNLLILNRESKYVDLCFAGHLDVVTPGPLEMWDSDPFTGEIRDGVIYGRGVVDMKGAIACFIDALLLHARNASITIGLIFTVDEELGSSHGMIPMVSYLKENAYAIQNCIIGESTSENKIGDSVRIGRRGSLSAHVAVNGVQGHVAYHKKAKNPIPEMLAKLQQLNDFKFDEGTEQYMPSNCEITNINVSTDAYNVIPDKVVAKFNIRFNNAHTVESLKKLIDDIFCSEHCEVVYEHGISAPFLSHSPQLMQIVAQSVEKCTGLSSEFNTGGGTSDARFLHKITNTIEIGLKNDTAHKANECSAISDLIILRDIYAEILNVFIYG